ncbi:Ribonuclease H2, subunit B [Penicillium griseofulvum]|uniref:Ribonuclease H2 subunit B n=1 Tax=Penicillium patulum TaxID=5078 RepID=A0A135LJ53_PENPA|nr:Ribonuclease H2, subunit B [Penicillium griseofulvum]KXG48940.1 Ribonuclease H2, subunit B [Penicillium griseofulvum]
MRTRSAPAKAKSEVKSEEQTKTKTLVAAEKPSKTFILPSSTSDNARLLSLPDPQSGELTRYFFCPDRGIYEFTVVAPPAHLGRSILFTPRTRKTPSSSEEEKKDTEPSAQGSITKKAEFLVATPIDAMFFMVPLLAPSPNSGRSLFQPFDDIIDSQDDMPKHLRQVLYDDEFRGSLLERVEAICEVVEAGDEKMFRFNETKLVQELVTKAERMADHGLPVSLEERFVREALATPLMSVKREDVVTSQEPSNESQESASKSEERQDSPSTVDTTATPSIATPVGESTPVPQPPSEESTVPDRITRLLRISTALSFMKESYLPTTMASRVDEILASAESPIDFKPLKDRLKEIAELRAQALASRDMSNFSRKRALNDEEEDTREEKKRRKDEEEKKSKAAESQAVKKLKKVNTSGMQKMSAFFAKAAPKKT